MSLDNVLIISFTSILIGVILLLFSNDRKIKYTLNTVKNKLGKIFLIIEQVYKNRLNQYTNQNTYILRFYAQIIDLVFIAMFIIINFYYSNESYIIFIALLSILIFFFPFILYRQSLGQKFMHLKIYKWNNEPVNEFNTIFIRYILKYLLYPLSIVTFLKSKILLHDIIFKTYEKQK